MKKQYLKFIIILFILKVWYTYYDDCNYIDGSGIVINSFNTDGAKYYVVKTKDGTIINITKESFCKVKWIKK